jgi:hypothetical protein
MIDLNNLKTWYKNKEDKSIKGPFISTFQDGIFFYNFSIDEIKAINYPEIYQEPTKYEEYKPNEFELRLLLQRIFESKRLISNILK